MVILTSEAHPHCMHVACADPETFARGGQTPFSKEHEE